MQGSLLQELNIGAPMYPKSWESLPDAPQSLQYVGDVALLATRKFTVVGSRTTPVQMRKLGKEVVGGIANHFTIVTGVADGGDETAIRGALEVDGKVICVLAGGFSAIPQSNLPLLKEVAKNGLLLSPYPYDAPTRSFSYEYRNKLLAYLGEGALVLGAGEKSGALITAKYAKKAGKEIFAFPYAPRVHAGVGCNRLIKEGAHLTESAEDVLLCMGITPTAKKAPVALTKEEQAVLETLALLSEAHVNELSSKSGIPVFKLRATLSALEIKGAITPIGGNRYAIV